jgi:hypothetical protein
MGGNVAGVLVLSWHSFKGHLGQVAGFCPSQQKTVCVPTIMKHPELSIGRNSWPKQKGKKMRRRNILKNIYIFKNVRTKVKIMSVDFFNPSKNKERK